MDVLVRPGYLLDEGANIRLDDVRNPLVGLRHVQIRSGPLLVCSQVDLLDVLKVN
jgi:hypothetical protein